MRLLIRSQIEYLLLKSGQQNASLTLKVKKNNPPHPEYRFLTLWVSLLTVEYRPFPL